MGPVELVRGVGDCCLGLPITSLSVTRRRLIGCIIIRKSSHSKICHSAGDVSNTDIALIAAQSSAMLGGGERWVQSSLVLRPHCRLGMRSCGRLGMRPHGRLGVRPHGRLGMRPHGRLGMRPHGRLGMRPHGRLGMRPHSRLGMRPHSRLGMRLHGRLHGYESRY